MVCAAGVAAMIALVLQQTGRLPMRVTWDRTSTQGKAHISSPSSEYRHLLVSNLSMRQQHAKGIRRGSCLVWSMALRSSSVVSSTDTPNSFL